MLCCSGTLSGSHSLVDTDHFRFLYVSMHITACVPECSQNTLHEFSILAEQTECLCIVPEL